MSCGAGFDSTFFRLKNLGYFRNGNCSYFEVDFPQSAQDKSGYILADRLIMNTCLNNDKRSYLIGRDGCLQIENYTVIGCDLTKTDELSEKLATFGFDFEKPTLVLCECSLTYVEASKASSFYRWIALNFADAHLFVYEQIKPNDRFGRIMKNHFQNRSTPLLNVQDFPTLEDQERRMRYLGFKTAKSTPLTKIMKDRYLESEQDRRKGLEPSFDELEEFFLKCSHYSVLEAKTQDSRAETFNDQVVTLDEESIKVEVLNCHSRFGRFGHFCIYSKEEDSVIVFGGISNSFGRDDLIAKFQLNNLSAEPIFETKLRSNCSVFASFCQSKLHPSKVFCFGGRSSPFEASSNLIEIDLKTNEQNIFKSCQNPEPRWKSSISSVIGPNKDGFLVMIGGKDASQVFSDVWKFEMKTKQWNKIDNLLPKGIFSHSVSNWESKLIVSGGIKSDERINDEIFILDFKRKPICSKFDAPGIKSRFSHSSEVYGSKLILIGGICQTGEAGIGIVDLENPCLSREFQLDIPRSVATYNHSHIRIKDKILIFGGGGNCFSFGMHIASNAIEIDLSKLLPESNSL